MNKVIAVLIVLISSSFFVVNAQNDEQLKDKLGKTITITGEATNAKLGALLIINDSTSIWMDEMDSWPKGYYLGEGKGRILKVTGTLIEKYNLPVFIYKEGEPSKSGIPFPEGTDLKKASQRYLLKDAKWELISE